MAADASTIFPTNGPLHLPATFGFRILSRDPTYLLDRGAPSLWRAGHTPEGPATVHLRYRDAARERIALDAWGPGATWAAKMGASLVGCHEPWTPIAGDHPVLRDLERKREGIRMARALSVVDVATRVVLQQRVTSKDAAFAQRRLVHRYGSKAPGGSDVPESLRLPPSAKEWAQLRYFHFHEAKVERSRAEIVRTVAKRGRRVEECHALPLDDARTRLSAIRGLGPWSVNFIAGVALGDTDAVPVGDYHLANTVAWALAGEERATDERMLELLEPFRPNRFRVIQLIEAAGKHAPRRGPRMPRMRWKERI